MSLANHSLYKVEGGLNSLIGTLADLGVTAALHTDSSQGDVTLELGVPRPFDGALLFEPFKRYDLVDATGAVRFVGWLLQPPRNATGNSEQHVYKFTGPWGNYLEGVGYKNPQNYANDPTDPGSAVGIHWTPIIIFNYQQGDGRIHLRDQIENALEFAQARALGYDPITGSSIGGSLTGAPFLYDVSEVPDKTPPYEVQKDKSCAEVIRAQLRWCPEIACRWNFGAIGAKPTLKFVANYGTAKRLDPTDAAIIGFSGVPRYDMLLSRVRITYTSENLASDGVKLWRTISTDTSTEANGSPRTLELSFELDAYDGTPGWTSAPAPEGLAALLHAPFKSLIYDLVWTRKGQEVTWDDRPAEKWNVVNVATGFENAGSVCQTIRRDIASGAVSYQTGLPRQLGLADLITLLRTRRRLGHSKMTANPDNTESGDGGGGTGGGGDSGGSGLRVTGPGGASVDDVAHIDFSDGFKLVVAEEEGGGEALVQVGKVAVVGAVNGVPSTLTVLTDLRTADGDWTAI